MVPDSENSPVWFLGKSNALVMLVIAVLFFVGARFFISDPRLDEPLHITLPFVDEVPVYKCPFKFITGAPCPLCGITTSSALVVRGDISGSFNTHPLGPFLALAMAIAIPWSLSILFIPPQERGSGVSEDSVVKRNRKISLIVLAVVVLAWIVSLVRYFL